MNPIGRAVVRSEEELTESESLLEQALWASKAQLDPVRYQSMIRALIEEVRRLKQGIWDMAGIAGVDQDGQKTPGTLAYPDIVTYGLKAVTDLRESYDEVLDE